jgi:hypothetical protein
MTMYEKYVIDKNSILEKAYRLVCLFFADKEITRRSNPDDNNAPLKSLENMFFASEATKVLLELAVSIRVFDDQIKKLPKNQAERINYEKTKAVVDQYAYGLFDDLGLTLRETCNKIIHSDVMEPHTSEGQEAHEYDSAYLYGEGDKEIDWKHLNGYVRLAGRKNGEDWYVLLDVEVFASAIYRLFTSV